MAYYHRYHDRYGKRGLVGEPPVKKKRPTLPAWGFAYAMRQAERLKLKYPKGLTGHDIALELGLSKKGATWNMNNRGFYTFDGHYRWEDVAAVLTYRQYRRQQQLDELLGRNK